MFREVENFLNAVGNDPSDKDVEAAFSSSIQDLGFFTFSAWVDGVTFLPSEGDVYSVHYPEDWLGHYHDREYWDVDPVYRLSRVAQSPFYWGDSAFKSQFTIREKMLMDEASEVGLEHGLVVPVRFAFDRPGYVSILGEGDPREGGGQMRLHNLAVHFFGLLRRSAKRRNGIDEFKPFPITQREKDCLQWTGVGRSDWDISALLGISEATVRLHLQRAMHKLGVPTRTQAVVQAILSGQIVL